MKRWAVVSMLVLAAALQPAVASTFQAMSTRELVRESSAVVEGEVLQVQAYWNDARQVIVTEAMVLVQGVLVGDAPTVVRVKTFGGTVDGYTIEASGFPKFERGQQLLLFLQRDREPDMMRITGYQQGQYRIERGQDGVEKAVAALEDGVRLLAADGREVSYAKVLPLATLRQQIRDEAARQAGAAPKN